MENGKLKVKNSSQFSTFNSQLPKGWEIKKLGEVCDLKSGKTIPSSIEKSEGEILYTKIGDMNIEGNEKYITLSSRYVEKKDIKENQIIPVGSIIFPKRGGAIATNKKRRIIKPTIVDLNTMALVPSKLINNDYLFFWFQQVDLAELSNGANIPQINNYSFDNVFISFPKSLPEQKRIVAILDRAFEAIDQAKANAQQNLKNAKELFESYLNRVFEEKGSDWEEKPLKELSKINYGYTEKAKFENIGPKFLRITDIQNNIVNWETVPYCKVNDEDLPKYKLEKGDIVFARTGATTGKSYLIQNPPISVFASYLIRLKLIDKDKFDAKFIMYFFNTKYYWDKINSGISGSTQGGFNATKLGNLNLVFPKPLETQKQIVQQLDALQAETKKLEAIYQQKIVDLEELKKSILQKAFNGEL